MPSPWNDTTDRQLLLVVIQLSSPQLPKWDEVANLMGPGFTAESVRQHFRKIRKSVKSAASGGSPAKSTSKKGDKVNGQTPSKSHGKRKGREVDGDDQNDEESVESPTKKHSPAKQQSVEVKAEEEEEIDFDGE